MPLDDLLRANLTLARIARRDGRITRRAVLRAAMLMAATSTLAPLARAADAPAVRQRFTGYPFTLGVASGYPRPDGVTIWTRLAPSPLAPDGAMQPQQVNVDYEVASDESFRQVVARGAYAAMPEAAHTVRADVRGLQPGRWYFYRFRVGDEVSAVGRTRTADAPDAKVARLRFAIASCQHYEQGYFTPHRHLPNEDLSLMLFLGDYIYEATWGDDLVRKHVGDKALDLAAFRIRYAQYRTDVELQRAHAAMPWAMVWDDHEVENDWAGDQGEHLDPAFLARRAAAFQAYFEHMPMPQSLRPRGADARIYDTLQFGDLARIQLLDDRQYRDPQSCPDPVKGGGSTDVFLDQCGDLGSASRTLLGKDQERWLESELANDTAQWNFIAQQTLFVPASWRDGGRTRAWNDGWDGYPAARERLLASLARGRTRNPVILGGDVHATFAADVHAVPHDGDSPIVATEYCGTSIGSQGWKPGAFDAKRAANPHIRYADGTKRGYLTFDLDARECRVAVRTVASEKTRESPIATTASFTTEAGRPGVHAARS